MPYLSFASSKRPAIAAACGADAEVPKKLGSLSGSPLYSLPRFTLVFTPFGAVKSGLSLKLASPDIGVPPVEEKASRSAVLSYLMAHTVMASAELAWPTIVE